MTFNRFSLVSLSCAGVLAGCSTPPARLETTHPASTSAAEATTPPARTSLHSDANSQRTRELLAQRDAEAKAAEAEPAVDETNATVRAARTSPGPIKGTQGAGEIDPKEGHENH